MKIRKYMRVEEIRGVYVCGGEKKKEKRKKKKKRKKKCVFGEKQMCIWEK